MVFRFINILAIVLLVKQRLVLSSICDQYSCNCIVSEFTSLSMEFANCSLIETNGIKNGTKNGSYNKFSVLLIEAVSNGTFPKEVFRDLEIGILIAENLGIEILEANVFDGVKAIKFLQLPKNRLINIDFSQFSSNFTGHLKSIDLKNNALAKIKNLSRLKSLENLYMSSNRMEKFSDLNNLTNLKRLDLSSNCIHSIETTALPKLEYLSLAGNKLLSLKDNSFHGFPNLVILKLSENQIDFLPRNVLSDLLRLKELHLQNNELTDLNENPFNGLSSLQLLDLSGNKFTSFKLDWIVSNKKLFSLDLSRNQIETLEFKSTAVLHALRILELSQNRLKSIGQLIEVAPKLSELLLSENFLSRIPAKLMRLNKLDLTNQNGCLREMGEQIYWRSRSGPTLLQLDLKNNSDLAFLLPKSLCFKDPNEGLVKPSHYLDLTISENALSRINKCALKQLNRFFRRVRIYVIKEEGSSETLKNHPICLCDVRMFLSRYNIIFKHDCPVFRTYCANKLRPIDNDCPPLDEC